MNNTFQNSPRLAPELNQGLTQGFAQVFKKKLISKLLISKSLISFAIALSLPAPLFAAYVPPSDQVPPRSRGGTAGRRSPCEITKPEITKPTKSTSSSYLGLAALAPVSYLGKTVSNRPTLAWYTDYCAVVPVQLSVYEYNSASNRLNEQPIFSQKLTVQPGISTFSLADQGITLMPGKTYAWQVVVDADSPAKSPWFRIPLQVSNPSAQLQEQLQQSPTLAKKIEIYAQAGFWYDALALTLKSEQPNKAAMISLLQQLATLEQAKEPSHQPLSRRFSYTLGRIVEIEKAPSKVLGMSDKVSDRLSQN